MKKALYRTFRPKTFDEVLDQDHITRVLKNQVKTGNIGHAYIFSGGRGTGKTSCAKIFSRAVNCLHPVDGNPCNECENCRAILDETTMDVVEMDAASNRRIDDIRELRETVIYPPTKLKYKVYIIDEAHMITKEAFNALLKIMEEPPSHLVFVLATTEIDKVPATILSRTQRYEFYRIGLPAIEKEIRMITGKLQVEVEEEAIHALALSADGAMRDALSLLDQVLATDQRPVTEELVNQVLGSIGMEDVYKLTSLILDDDIQGALTYTENLYSQGKDAHSLSHELILYFQRLLLLAGGVDGRKLNISSEDRDKMEELAKKTSLNRLVDSLHILIQTDLDMRKADYPEALFEACLVRLLDYVSEKEIISRLEAVEDKLAIVDRWQDPDPLIRASFKKLIQEEGVAQLGPAPSQPSDPAPGEDPPRAESREEGNLEATVSKEAGSKSQPSEALNSKPKILEEKELGGQEEAEELGPEPENKPGPKPEVETSLVEEGRGDQAGSPAGEEAGTKSKKSPAALEFEADPDRWLEDHRKELVKQKIIDPFFVGQYQAVDLEGNHLFLTYEKGSAQLGVLQKHQELLEDFLNKKTGGSYRLKIVDQRPKKTHKSPAKLGNSNPSKSGQEKKPGKKEKKKSEPKKAEGQKKDLDPKESGQEESGPSQKDPILAKLRGIVPEELIEIQRGSDFKNLDQ